MIAVLLWFAVVPSALALGWFAAEILAGVRGLAEPAACAASELVVIVPAHNEEAGIGAMLDDLASALALETVVVVADNCTDRTADIARVKGAMVSERRDLSRRGKGYALAHAREFLASKPPLAVMILDADCRIARGDPRDLAGRALRDGVVVQAENLQVAGPDAPPKVQIGAFAFLVMNILRARGLERLAGGTMLQGTGIVLAWPIFARMPLATEDVVEDVGLTIALARQGVRVRLDSRCRVTSLSAGEAGHLEQRRRWEAGFIRSMGKGIALFITGVGSASRLRAGIGLHMMVPPLALLLLVASAIAASAGGLAHAGWAPWQPFWTIIGTLGAAAAAVLIAYLGMGRDVLPPKSLARIPGYVAWKIPIYAQFLIGRRDGWVRTQRPDNPYDRRDV